MLVIVAAVACGNSGDTRYAEGLYFSRQGSYLKAIAEYDKAIETSISTEDGLSNALYVACLCNIKYATSFYKKYQDAIEADSKATGITYYNTLILKYLIKKKIDFNEFIELYNNEQDDTFLICCLYLDSSGKIKENNGSIISRISLKDNIIITIKSLIKLELIKKENISKNISIALKKK